MNVHERDYQRNRELFRKMSRKEKLAHIWLYYKAVFFLIAVAAVVLVSVIYTSLTRKEPVLYAAYTNVTLSEEAEQSLWAEYLTSRNLDPEKTEVYLHRDLYLSDNPAPENSQLAYNSHLKVMATIDAEQLDIILMDREAYDICSACGYLLDLSKLFPADDPRISAYAVSNLVILEENVEDYSLGLAEELIYITDTVVNALEVTELPWVREAGLTGEVYLGILFNSPRLDTCADYILYLTDR